VSTDEANVSRGSLHYRMCNVAWPFGCTRLEFFDNGTRVSEHRVQMSQHIFVRWRTNVHLLNQCWTVQNSLFVIAEVLCKVHGPSRSIYRKLAHFVLYVLTS